MNEFIIKDGVLIQYNGFDSEITIPNGVSKIENKTFYRCNFLTKIVIPNSVIEIGEYAFADCYLENIKLPENLKLVGKYAFANTKLKSEEIVFKQDCFIEDTAFYGCEDSEEEYLESIAKSEAFLSQEINPWKFIDVQSEQILKLSEEIIGNLKTDYEKARAISEWIVEHIKYDDYRKMNRTFSSVVLEPEEVSVRGCTVCEGYARLTKALLCAIHIPTLHIIGHLKGQESVWHAWNTAFIDGHWIWIDNANGIKNFDMPTKAFAKTHRLDGGIKIALDHTVAVEQITEIFGYKE